jgi:hypothetical protein
MDVVLWELVDPAHDKAVDLPDRPAERRGSDGGP